MISEPVLVDTGPLIALYSEADSHHAVCTEQMASLPVGKVYTCWPVITETVYMLRKRPEQRADLLQAVINGELSILRLRDSDIKPVRDIFAKYYDQDIDFADACLLHLADRESIDAIFTIDRRHFSILRKQNGQMFCLKVRPTSGQKAEIFSESWELRAPWLRRTFVSGPIPGTFLRRMRSCCK